MTGTLTTFCVEMTGLPCNSDDSSGIAEEMPNTPSGLKLLSRYEVGSDCTSVSFDSRSGDLILGCTDGVKILRKGSHEAKEKTQHCNATVAVHKGNLFIAGRKDEEILEISVYNMETRQTELTFSFSKVSGLSSYLAVSDHFIVCTDKNENQEAVKLFDWEKKPLKTIQLPQLTKYIRNMRFLRDGSILVTGGNGGIGNLNKYKISRTQSTDDNNIFSLIWSCALHEASGIDVSSDERLIFVCKHWDKVVYVIDYDGEYNFTAAAA